MFEISLDLFVDFAHGWSIKIGLVVLDNKVVDEKSDEILSNVLENGMHRVKWKGQGNSDTTKT